MDSYDPTIENSEPLHSVTILHFAPLTPHSTPFYLWRSHTSHLTLYPPPPSTPHSSHLHPTTLTTDHVAAVENRIIYAFSLTLHNMHSHSCSPLFFFPAAFEKVVTYRGQEFHTQLIDTAGQVPLPDLSLFSLLPHPLPFLPPSLLPIFTLSLSLSLSPSLSFPHYLLFHSLPSLSSLLSSFPLPQDEYFMIPQSYTVGIHGYVLVYSVTSTKR